MLYDLTSLQREANTRFGFSARRTLAAAQRLYEEHKALTYPRTSSRYLTSDMVGEIKPTAELVGRAGRVPQGRGVRDGARRAAAGPRRRRRKVTDHHAIIPTRAEHPVEKMDGDDRRDLRHGRAALPRRLPPRSGVREHARRDDGSAGPQRDGGYVFRTRGKLLLVPGWRGVYGEARPMRRSRRRRKPGEEDEGTDQQLPRLEQGEDVATREDRERAQGNQAAAPLQRRLAARRDGDRRQARRRRGAARGDEGLGDRHAGDARGDHRAADRRRLRRARRARAGGDREGAERDPAARRARADLARN